MYLVLHNTALVLPINYREMSLFSQTLIVLVDICK